MCGKVAMLRITEIPLNRYLNRFGMGKWVAEWQLPAFITMWLMALDVTINDDERAGFFIFSGTNKTDMILWGADSKKLKNPGGIPGFFRFK